MKKLLAILCTIPVISIILFHFYYAAKYMINFYLTTGRINTDPFATFSVYVSCWILSLTFVVLFIHGVSCLCDRGGKE